LGAAGGGAGTVAGIYLDGFSLGSTVRGNVVYDTPYGVIVNDGSGHLVEDNKIWLTNQAAVLANMSQTDADYMTGNTFR
jgi:hypothetical protein